MIPLLERYSLESWKKISERFKEYSSEYVVSAYIVFKNKICLIKHNDLKMWLPPGGHIKKSETPYDAILREIMEETGWTVEVENNQDYYTKASTVWQVPTPRNIQIEIIKEENRKDHIHINLVYFFRAICKICEVDYTEGMIKWHRIHELDKLLNLYEHTKMYAITAIRELGNIIPKKLIVESDRVLIPIGGSCAYKCKYCHSFEELREDIKLTRNAL